MQLYQMRRYWQTIVILFVVAVLCGLAIQMGGGEALSLLSSLATILGSPQFVAAAVIATTPLLLAALGGLFSELSGVLNLALEAMMLCGALAAYVGANAGGSPWTGLAAAAAAGGIIGLMHAWFSITLRSNQIVSAVALNLFALAVTAFGFRLIYGRAALSFAPGFKSIYIPVLSDLPYLGVALFQYNILIYLSLLLVPLLWFILYKTTWGLTLRAVGEHPLAADTVAINVNRVRYVAVLVSGVVAGISGSALVSASNLNVFQENLSAGRGYIAFAAIVFGRWHPVGILMGTLLFGLGDALQIRLQAYGVAVPHELLFMLPYLITLVALVTVMRNARGPVASGVAYVKEG